jgi:DnaJ-class molecular chaperone
MRSQPIPLSTDNDKVLLAFQALGLKGDVGPDDIRAAYGKRLFEYHPDKVSTLGSKI